MKKTNIKIASAIRSIISGGNITFSCTLTLL